ncbi:hypothetical protein SAMN04487831_103258 [Pseudobutyrivibrio sp. UC1225]|uniref:glycosyltransferase n=1 Tax=Pseudobutyrivibrio sp. UC1225 TaxID=1798185 RepID=UPI0008E231E5|nr:glycosyltransferase [Pseudobutyrivibrio sp. UC1225]SFN77910.1 hypothetical protein SAMN04487831_103258 [Pseudobutyrivibrio sp. UC1225]
MINKLYSNVKKAKKNSRGYWRYLFKLNKLIVNYFYPLSQKNNTKIGIDKSSDVIVSLTTYPARINTVWVTISTLLNQTFKPAKVVLYLSKEQFPNGADELPVELLKQQSRGLEIGFVDDDLKPHKKYYYALQDYPDKMVITADDDVFYPENHIEKLVEASKKYPDAVICLRSHRITTNDGEFTPYNSWKEVLTDEPDFATIPIGCNGALYKRKFFDEELFDAEKIKEYALFTDDLWLKIMELKNGVKAYNCAEEPLIYFDNIFNKNTGLWHANASEDSNRNDDVWGKLIEKYTEIKELLI